LKVDRRKLSFSEGWEWSLPSEAAKGPKAPKAPQPAHVRTGGALGIFHRQGRLRRMRSSSPETTRCSDAPRPRPPQRSRDSGIRGRSQLRVAPRSAITDEVRQLVRIHKDELLTALEAEARLRELAAELDLPVDELLRCYRDYAADIADCQPTTCGGSSAALPPSGTTTGT